MKIYTFIWRRRRRREEVLMATVCIAFVIESHSYIKSILFKQILASVGIAAENKWLHVLGFNYKPKEKKNWNCCKNGAMSNEPDAFYVFRT